MRPGKVSALLGALVLAACSGQSDTSTPSAQSTVTAQPTATLEPGAAFLAAMDGPNAWLRATYSGTQTIEGTVTGVSGEYEADATSFRATMRSDDGKPATEQRYIGKQNYFLDRDGLWYVSDGAWIKGSLVGVLAGGGCLAHTNTDGTATVTIGSDTIADVTNSLGLTDDTFSDVTGTAELTIGADCQPLLMDVNAAATGLAGTSKLSVTYRVRLAFDQTGSRPVLARPARAWTVYQDSADYGYIIAIPDGWTVSRKTTESGGQFDEMVGEGSEVQVWGFDTHGATAEAWFKEVVADVSDPSWLGKLDSNEPLKVAGAPGLLLAGHHTEDGETIFALVAVAYVGDHAFDFIWYSASGMEDADRELFLQMMGTLTLL